ncbi:glutamate racemase [Thiofilum flexile]|uniref:glutamate racemase n=1 Tax=Thiofilum flexile TaxID=125627 RepID=UPI000369E2A7|nr:glutamate racemase [Thiofilum flexile]
MSNQPIGVFDSGLGGLSVLLEIERQLPAEDLVYVADSAHAPYGAKTADYMAERCIKISDFLLSQRVKVIVVACNTATAYAAEVLRQHLTIPIIGLEPAVKPAVKLTQTGKIGVLATRQTANSARLQRLIDTYAQNTQVVVQACPGLVEHVEAGDFNSAELKQLLSEYLKPLQEQGVDTLVLGCTHYPFLRQTLMELIQGQMTIVETSQAVTRQVVNILTQHQLLQTNPLAQRRVQFYSSLQGELLEKSAKSAALLWQRELELLSLPAEFR